MPRASSSRPRRTTPSIASRRSSSGSASRTSGSGSTWSPTPNVCAGLRRKWRKAPSAWPKIESTLSRAAMEDEFRALSKEVAAILARFGADGTTGADIDYVEFERRFRGDAADIAEGQHRYVALFPPAMLPGQIVDIGCGRGEMLELLAAEGHEVLGVDMDPDMVVVCHEKGTAGGCR